MYKVRHFKIVFIHHTTFSSTMDSKSTTSSCIIVDDCETVRLDPVSPPGTPLDMEHEMLIDNLRQFAELTQLRERVAYLQRRNNTLEASADKSFHEKEGLLIQVRDQMEYNSSVAQQIKEATQKIDLLTKQVYRQEMKLGEREETIRGLLLAVQTLASGMNLEMLD